MSALPTPLALDLSSLEEIAFYLHNHRHRVVESGIRDQEIDFLPQNGGDPVDSHDLALSAQSSE